MQVEVAAEIPGFGLVETSGFAHGVVVEPVGPAVTLHLGVDHRAHGHDPVERVARAVHQVVLDARIPGDVGRNLQPVLEQRAGRVDAEVILVVLRAFEDAVLPQVAHRQRVGQLVGAAVELHVVVVQDRGLEVEVGPVAVGVERRIVALAEMLDVALAVTGLLARVEARLVVEVHVIDRSEQVGIAGHLLDRDVSVVLDLQAARTAFLRGDEDDAVGGLVAVDGGRGGVFQDRHRLDVLGVHLVERRFESVDDDQRRRIVERADAAHGDRAAVGSGLARGLGHLHARDLAVLEVGGRDRRYGAREFLLAGRAVADDHDVLHGEGVLFERDVGAGHGLRHFELLFLVAEIRYLDRLADTGRDGERAVRAGRRAGLPALDSYDDARDRVVLFVRDLSLDADLCAGLRMHGQEEEPGQRREPQTQMGAIAVFHVQRFLGW